jgi:hypothetical protein
MMKEENGKREKRNEIVSRGEKVLMVVHAQHTRVLVPSYD